MSHADERRRLLVRANADTGEDAARARRFGAQGIGLCRTEHMFLGERRATVERLVLATTDAEREAALAELLPLQRGDFIEIFTEMAGQAVTIRLLDPPLHEFLPDLTELSVKVALEHDHGEHIDKDEQAARGRAQAARGEPDARAARRAAGHRGQGAVRDAGPRDRAGGRRGPPPRSRGAPADHGPAGRFGAGAADGGGGDLRRAGRRGGSARAWSWAPRSAP